MRTRAVGFRVCCAIFKLIVLSSECESFESVYL